MTTRDDAGRTLDVAEDELLDAMRSGEILALDKLISDDLEFIDTEGAVLTKQADLEAHRSGATDFERINELSRRTFEFGGSGTTDTEAIAVLRVGAALITVRLLWRREWRVINGRWQVVAGSVVALD